MVFPIQHFPYLLVPPKINGIGGFNFPEATLRLLEKFIDDDWSPNESEEFCRFVQEIPEDDDIPDLLENTLTLRGKFRDFARTFEWLQIISKMFLADRKKLLPLLSFFPTDSYSMFRKKQEMLQQMRDSPSEDWPAIFVLWEKLILHPCYGSSFSEKFPLELFNKIREIASNRAACVNRLTAIMEVSSFQWASSEMISLLHQIASIEQGTCRYVPDPSAWPPRSIINHDHDGAHVRFLFEILSREKENWTVEYAAQILWNLGAISERTLDDALLKLFVKLYNTPHWTMEQTLRFSAILAHLDGHEVEVGTARLLAQWNNLTGDAPEDLAWVLGKRLFEEFRPDWPPELIEERMQSAVDSIPQDYTEYGK